MLQFVALMENTASFLSNVYSEGAFVTIVCPKSVI